MEKKMKIDQPNSNTDSINTKKPIEENIRSITAKELRSGKGDKSLTIYLNESERSGNFRYISSDLSSEDDSSMIIRSGNRRYIRQYDGYVNIKWFGAKGNGIVDDTEAEIKAVRYVKSKGGGKVYHPMGTYLISKKTGTVEIKAHDDGTISSGHGANISPENIFYQSYCVSIPSGITLTGDGAGKTIIKSNYQYGNASLSENIIFLATETYDYGIEGIKFTDCFMAFGGINTTLATSNFSDIKFANCAFGIYSRVLEQCTFKDIVSNGTASPLLFGGQWHSRNDTYNELGGFIDKSTFSNIRNNFGRVLGKAEKNIDSYFDQYFFKSTNNDTRLSSPINSGSVVKNSGQTYKGVSGFTILCYSRYARQSNSNIFSVISHANSARPGIFIANGTTCKLDIIYFENVGYHDNQLRKEPVGSLWTDQYLGDSVRVRELIGGFDKTSYVSGIQAQFVFSNCIIGQNIPGSAEKIFFCNLLKSRESNLENSTTILGNLNVNGNILSSSNSQAQISGMTVISKEFSENFIDIGINSNAGGGGGVFLVMVSRNTSSGSNTNASLYILNLGFDGNFISSNVISGSDIVNFSVNKKNGNVMISGKSPNNYKAVILGR